MDRLIYGGKVFYLPDDVDKRADCLEDDIRDEIKQALILRNCFYVFDERLPSHRRSLLLLRSDARRCMYRASQLMDALVNDFQGLMDVANVE